MGLAIPKIAHENKPPALWLAAKMAAKACAANSLINVQAWHTVWYG